MRSKGINRQFSFQVDFKYKSTKQKTVVSAGVIFFLLSHNLDNCCDCAHIVVTNLNPGDSASNKTQHVNKIVLGSSEGNSFRFGGSTLADSFTVQLDSKPRPADCGFNGKHAHFTFVIIIGML